MFIKYTLVSVFVEYYYKYICLQFPNRSKHRYGRDDNYTQSRHEARDSVTGLRSNAAQENSYVHFDLATTKPLPYDYVEVNPQSLQRNLNILNLINSRPLPNRPSSSNTFYASMTCHPRQNPTPDQEYNATEEIASEAQLGNELTSVISYASSSSLPLLNAEFHKSVSQSFDVGIAEDGVFLAESTRDRSSLEQPIEVVYRRKQPCRHSEVKYYSINDEILSRNEQPICLFIGTQTLDEVPVRNTPVSSNRIDPSGNVPSSHVNSIHAYQDIDLAVTGSSLVPSAELHPLRENLDPPVPLENTSPLGTTFRRQGGEKFDCQLRQRRRLSTPETVHNTSRDSKRSHSFGEYGSLCVQSNTMVHSAMKEDGMIDNVLYVPMMVKNPLYVSCEETV